MDTSETYIKMRIMAIPELGEGILPANDSLTWICNSVYTDEIGNFYCVSHQKERELWCQLERQDQLQDMIYTDGTIKDIYRQMVFHLGEPDDFMELTDYYQKFTSMEQVWLAFVMKEQHGKIWDNEIEQWVKLIDFKKKDLVAH